MSFNQFHFQVEKEKRTKEIRGELVSYEADDDDDPSEQQSDVAGSSGFLLKAFVNPDKDYEEGDGGTPGTSGTPLSSFASVNIEERSSKSNNNNESKRKC